MGFARWTIKLYVISLFTFCLFSAFGEDNDVSQPKAIDNSILLSEANDFFDDGNYESAAEIYATILEVDPESEDAALAYTYSLLAINEASTLIFLESINNERSKQNSDELRVELACLWFRRGRNERALEVIVDNELPGAALVRGQIYFERGETNTAIAEFKKAYIGGEATAEYFLGEALLQAGRYNESAEYFDIFISRYPYSAFAYAALGETFHRGGNYDVALEQYNIALELDSACVRALSNKASLSYEDNDFSTAIKLYNEVLLYNPSDKEALYNLALVYENVDDSVARLKWQQLIELCEDSSDDTSPVTEDMLKLAHKKIINL